MGYALLGHGGLELEDGGYPDGMGVVAINAGTTLQVYSDAGQAVRLGKNEYDIWGQIQAPWPAMDSKNVTYNLSLTFNEDDDKLEKDEPGYFAKALAPHTIVRAGADGIASPLLLCTGDPTTCPTDPRMITGAVAGPTEHTCDGILGTYKGELLWMACTVIVTDDAETAGVVEASLGGRPDDVFAGMDPDDPSAMWYRYESDYPTFLSGWFDEQRDAVKEQLRTDPHIAEWEQNR